jgi:polyphosphate:AMP phosphotransferase
MFESAELGHRIDKATYAQEEPKLREALLDAQYDLLQAAGFQVLILINGVAGAGKGETVNLLSEWMDPRHIRAHAFAEPSDEERERPPMWRFWRALPPKGAIGILFDSWYSEPIEQRVRGSIKTPELEQRIDEIARFERMLTDEGALILKFWFHLAKATQKKRLQALARDPDTRWRVSEADWEHVQHYDKYRKHAEFTLRRTSSAEAPWIVVESTDERYRNLTVGKRVLAALRERLDQSPPKPAANKTPPLLPALDQRNLLGTLDYSLALPKKKYQKSLETWQGRLNLLSRHPRFRRISVAVVFEGMDAAGKGGAIRRVAAALDARYYQVIPVAAPTEEERAQPYLWRFWRHVPRLGRITLYDRSWYGRVLVERIEGFCQEADWMRAYSEINDFEEQLASYGICLVKFWLAITQDEQLRRFQEREQTGFKRFKINPEDWQNRDKWEAYELAVCDMVDRTSTANAPWTLVEANDKYFARVKIISTLCERIEQAL